MLIAFIPIYFNYPDGETNCGELCIWILEMKQHFIVISLLVFHRVNLIFVGVNLSGIFPPAKWNKWDSFSLQGTWIFSLVSVSNKGQ